MEGSGNGRRSDVGSRKNSEKSDNKAVGFRGRFRTVDHCLRDIRTMPELPKHKDVSPTVIYTHALNKPRLSVRSPLDRAARLSS